MARDFHWRALELRHSSRGIRDMGSLITRAEETREDFDTRGLSHQIAE